MQLTLSRAAVAVALAATTVAGFQSCSSDSKKHGSADAGTADGFDSGAADAPHLDVLVDSDGGAEMDVASPSVAGASWELVPGSQFSGPECWFFQGVPGTLKFPPLAWQSCGTGCELADVIQGYPVAEASAVAASTTQGVAYVRFSYLMKDGASTKVLSRVVRLADGVTIAALLKDDHGTGPEAWCYISESRHSARFVDLRRTQPPTAELSGLGPAAPGGNWTWSQPSQLSTAIPPGKSGIPTDSAYFLLGSGGVYARLDLTKSDWTTIEAPSTALWGGGDGDLMVWTESDSDRVRGWAPDGKGPRTLLQSAPGKTWLLQPSKTRIVGVAVDANFETTLSTSVRFWHMPRVYSEGTSPVVHADSANNVLVGETFFRTWGDFAAVQAFDHPSGAPINFDLMWLLVVNVATGKAWRVEAGEGYRIQFATWAFDDSWLYFGETLPGVQHEKSLSRIRRIKLVDLDSWGKSPK